ncbi:MAG TPA: hypothetical protein PL072_00455 [Phycisphaerales bacterium]|nr:hypothetical protein [Phycisphaerales bacterium]
MTGSSRLAHDLPRRTGLGLALLLLTCGGARGQDSVPSTPGGNDALSPYDATTLETRYVVDAAPLTTSWGRAWWVAPVLKATREINPLYRTNILGAAAVSPTFKTGVAFTPTNFALWSAAGAGVHPTANTAPGSVSIGGFDQQWALAFCDFALNPTNVVAATVGRDDAQPARWYVRRVHAVSSRFTSGSADTSTLSIGSVSPDGRVYIRADNFNTLPATSTRISGDNILSFSLGALASPPSSVNTLFLNAGVNSAGNTGATTYIVRNDAAPHNTPSNAYFDATGNAYALIFDVRAFFRAGSTTGDLTAATTSHRPAGSVGHRGNPSYAPISPLGGVGTVAALAKPSAGGSAAPVNLLAAFAVNSSGSSVPAVVAGSARSFAIPSPLSVPGFTANTSGLASFQQYLSQETFRGANGQVGVGQNALGQLVLAAVASDPTADDFVAVVTATGPSTSSWSVAAYPGMSVLNGQDGVPIGAIQSPDATFSAPAVDLLGNVYFTATWTPTGQPSTTGLFKAVNTPDGYQLEKILSVGDSFTGLNSARVATVSAITLSDADSLASGAFHSSSLLQQQSPGATTSDPTDAKAAGGLIVNVILTYNNAGTPEGYDAVLMLMPQVPGATPPCPADFDHSGAIEVADLFGFLDAWFVQFGMSEPPTLSADFIDDGEVNVADLFAFLDAWFAAFGTNCP